MCLESESKHNCKTCLVMLPSLWWYKTAAAPIFLSIPDPSKKVLTNAESSSSSAMVMSFVGVMCVLRSGVHFEVWQTGLMVSSLSG